MHHDLGCLGAALNTRALTHQLEILKSMGCNAIRTSHNPPAPDLLDLCDQMGFLVMDEAFDVWNLPKMKYDYHLYFKDWHERDLSDMVLRDRNHPSVFLWSIGNEIPEKNHTKYGGAAIAKELDGIIKKYDKTRFTTSAFAGVWRADTTFMTDKVDVIGINYTVERYPEEKAKTSQRILLPVKPLLRLATVEFIIFLRTPPSGQLLICTILRLIIMAPITTGLQR